MVRVGAYFRIFILFIIIASSSTLEANKAPLPLIPAAWEGRFLPSSTYAKHWLYERYHSQEIAHKDLIHFSIKKNSGLNLVWKMHFLGYVPWKESPLFWIQRAELKKVLGLKLKEERFSYSHLKTSIEKKGVLNPLVAKKLMLHHFFQAFKAKENRERQTILELKQLHPGLWLELKDNKIFVASLPEGNRWSHFQRGQEIADQANAAYKETIDDKQSFDDLNNLLASLSEFERLHQSKNIPSEKEHSQHFTELIFQNIPPQGIAFTLEQNYPLEKRLQEAGSLLKILPSKMKEGVWYSPHAFHVKVYNPKTDKLEYAENFTAYSDDDFIELRSSYFEWENAVLKRDKAKALKFSSLFADKLLKSYSTIATLPYRQASGKTLNYPSFSQLFAERVYFDYPLIGLCIAGYSFSLIACFLGLTSQDKRSLYFALTFLIATFLLHTFILGLRSYILSRPPVSNMFETALYVPWVAVATSLLLFFFKKNPLPLIASALSSVCLLAILKFSSLSDKFENLQAVLDSQYWLIIHVLMVVGSYGIFILAGVLAHVFLINSCFIEKKSQKQSLLATTILQAIYLGTALLVGGTLLGGAWAAESWGRFWDWDPKESWAFISICIYALLIHAFRFGKIANFGLAIGAIIGLMMISFTWYGVNYILGTGLHSYGFGYGGQWIYYSYLSLEMLFVSIVAMIQRRRSFTLQKPCK